MMKPNTNKTTTTKVTTPLRDQCLSHFATPGIPVEPAALDELLSRAEKEGRPHLQFLDLLLGAQANARRERGVARRIREAHFAEDKTLEGFDWQSNPEAFGRAHGRAGHRRFHSAPDQFDPGRLERDWQKPHHPSHRAEGLCTWLPRSVPHLRRLAGRFDSIAGRQNSTRTPTLLCQPGSPDNR